VIKFTVSLLVFLFCHSLCSAKEVVPQKKVSLSGGCTVSLSDTEDGWFKINSEDSAFYISKTSIYDQIVFICQAKGNSSELSGYDGQPGSYFMGNYSRLERGLIGFLDPNGKYPIRKINRSYKVKNKSGHVFEVIDLMYSWSDTDKKSHRSFLFCTFPDYQLCGNYYGASEERGPSFLLTNKSLVKLLKSIDVDIPYRSRLNSVKSKEN